MAVRVVVVIQKIQMRRCCALDVPITDDRLSCIERMKKRGVKKPRIRKNQHSSWPEHDSFKIREKGFLFPSDKSEDGHLGYHGVWAAVDALSKRFDAEFPGNDFARHFDAIWQTVVKYWGPMQALAQPPALAPS